MAFTYGGERSTLADLFEEESGIENDRIRLIFTCTKLGRLGLVGIRRCAHVRACSVPTWHDRNRTGVGLVCTLIDRRVTSTSNGIPRNVPRSPLSRTFTQIYIDGGVHAWHDGTRLYVRPIAVGRVFVSTWQTTVCPGGATR